MAPEEPHKTASDKTSPVASTTLSSSVFNWRLCPFTASLTPLKSMWTTVGWSASDEAHRFVIELELASGNSETRTLELHTYVHVFTPQLAYADGNLAMLKMTLQMATSQCKHLGLQIADGDQPMQMQALHVQDAHDFADGDWPMQTLWLADHSWRPGNANASMGAKENS